MKVGAKGDMNVHAKFQEDSSTGKKDTQLFQIETFCK